VEGATRVSSRERVTRDPGDLGIVINSAGVAIGRLQDDGHVVPLYYDRGDVDPDRPQVADCYTFNEIRLDAGADPAQGVS
jgi:hypothetical protein